MEKRDTVSKIAGDLIQKEAPTRDPIELERASQEEYIKNVLECVDTHKKQFDSDFFVSVLHRQERSMPNVIRRVYFATKSCPTPNYDQIIYKYHKASDDLEFIWSIPDQKTTWTLWENAAVVTESERGLLKFVLDFTDGTLFRLCKKLNGEADYSPHLINQPKQFTVN